MRPGYCEERWWAPRGDAPRSAEVEHVCRLIYGHLGQCQCSCGARDEDTHD